MDLFDEQRVREIAQQVADERIKLFMEQLVGTLGGTPPTKPPEQQQ